jgi:hypothetical protein
VVAATPATRRHRSGGLTAPLQASAGAAAVAAATRNGVSAEALDFVAKRPRPLALYLFTCDKALQERVMIQTHAGSMAINEAVLQMRFMYPPYGAPQWLLKWLIR